MVAAALFAIEFSAASIKSVYQCMFKKQMFWLLVRYSFEFDYVRLRSLSVVQFAGVVDSSLSRNRINKCFVF